MEMTRRNALQGGSAVLGAGLFGGRSLAQSRLASLAYGPATGVYSLGSIADAKGFLKAEGLDFKLVVGNAGTHGRQSLAAGQALFAHGDASHPLQLSTRGKKAKIVLATQMIASIANIVVRKDLFDAGIDSVEKLAAYKRPNGGKPILAATAIGSGTWMYGTYTFESKGLGNTVTWVAGGGLNTMLPALETKQFDAIMAVPGWVIEAESKGFGKAIFDTSKPGVFTGAYGGTVPVLVIYTLEDTIEQNRKSRTVLRERPLPSHALGKKDPGRRGPRPRSGEVLPRPGPDGAEGGDRLRQGDLGLYRPDRQGVVRTRRQGLVSSRDGHSGGAFRGHRRHELPRCCPGPLRMTASP